MTAKTNKKGSHYFLISIFLPTGPNSFSAMRRSNRYRGVKCVYSPLSPQPPFWIVYGLSAH